MSDDPSIRTEGLTKVYGSGNTEVVALRDVDLSVRRGEVAALLGPSGSGKTTLVTVIGLTNAPTRGRIFIRGQLVMDGARPLTNLTRFRGKHIGYVFQRSNLVPFLTARENVQISMELDGWSRRAAHRRAMELLEELGVADRAGFYPPALSGGQQQRVAIARALANHPSVILADEPTAALDSHRGRQVMELFRTVAHERGAGVLVVTHDHRALDVFDTLHELEDGLLRAPSSSGIEA
ncbi:MAG: ABC transporter ATP-binding protein [Phycisphaerae bacterium]|nr:ABC transporter ATP-binding protein [Phycisphaerae bacterium]